MDVEVVVEVVVEVKVVVVVEKLVEVECYRARENCTQIES